MMNRYYPPDFDPSKLLPASAIRQKRTSGPRQLQIRMMLPFTMRCDHCGQFLYIATKFNSRCEKIPGKTELGLNAYRFYGSCKHCKGEFIFRTDPDHSDYLLESGGTRSYEAHKDADYAEAEVAKSKADAEAESESQALENKIYDTAEEMRKMEELGELRSINKREAKRNEAIHAAIERVTQKAFEETLDKEDEREFRQFKKQAVTSSESVETAKPKPAISGFKGLSSLGIKIKPKKT